MAGEEGDHTGGRAQGADALAHQHPRHPLGRGGFGKRSGHDLQPGQPVGHPLGPGSRLLGFHPDRLFAAEQDGPLRFGVVAGGDVDRDADHADEVAARVEQRRVDDVGEDARPVLAAHGQLALPRQATGQAGRDLPGGRQLVGRHAQLDQVGAHRFLFGPAVQRLGLAVPVEDRAVDRGDHHCGTDVIEDLGGEATLPPGNLSDGVARRHEMSRQSSSASSVWCWWLPPLTRFGMSPSAL